MTPEYFIIPMLMNQFTNIVHQFKTDIYILDCFIIITCIIIIFTIDFTQVKQDITRKIRNYMRHGTENSIIISCEGNKRSIKFRAIMFYISKLKDSSIYCLKENTDFTWGEEIDIEKNSEYMVDQIKTFKLDNDIYGYIKDEKKEKRRARYNEVPEYIEYNILRIYTKHKTLIELQEWINKKVSEYNKHIRSKTSDVQLLLTISQKNKIDDDTVDIEAIPWESTVTFENSYFHMKDEIIKKIDFFLNNKSWYEEYGTPYNLGILLYGEPGCGKTRFIKQLMNYTKRHAIDIKLNDCFDFNELKNIIYKDEIGTDYNIPQNQRIIIFEDIDSMGEVVKDRDIKKNEQNKKNTNINKNNPTDILASFALDKKIKKNNNLSFLLNILDGLNECSGRIIVMTTNKIETLDKALIRPGRIDIMLEFKKCSIKDIFMMIKHFHKIDITSDIIKTELDFKYTSAELINILRTTDINELKNKFFNS